MYDFKSDVITGIYLIVPGQDNDTPDTWSVIDRDVRFKPITCNQLPRCIVQRFERNLIWRIGAIINVHFTPTTRRY